MDMPEQFEEDREGYEKWCAERDSTAPPVPPKMIGRQRSAESLEREFNEYMKCLAESIGCDMAIFNLPSAHGNDRLRWAVLIQERLDEIGAMKRTGVNGGNLTH